jgi:hypothetical protein
MAAHGRAKEDPGYAGLRATSSQSPRETLDLFLSQEAAEAELAEILEDEPSWVDVLRVVPIEIDEQAVSEN